MNSSSERIPSPYQRFILFGLLAVAPTTSRRTTQPTLSAIKSSLLKDSEAAIQLMLSRLSVGLELISQTEWEE